MKNVTVVLIHPGLNGVIVVRAATLATESVPERVYSAEETKDVICLWENQMTAILILAKKNLNGRLGAHGESVLQLVVLGTK